MQQQNSKPSNYVWKPNNDPSQPDRRAQRKPDQGPPQNQPQPTDTQQNHEIPTQTTIRYTKACTTVVPDEKVFGFFENPYNTTLSPNPSPIAFKSTRLKMRKLTITQNEPVDIASISTRMKLMTGQPPIYSDGRITRINTVSK